MKINKVSASLIFFSWIMSAAAGAIYDARGDRPTLVLVVNFSDHPMEKSVDEINQLVFGEDFQSVSRIYKESSWGQTTISGVVAGPFTVQHAHADGYPADWRGKDKAEVKAQAEAAGYKFGDYKHVIYLFPQVAPFCGVGSIGGNPGGSALGGKCSTSPAPIAHELGHNMHLRHAGTDFNDDGVVEKEYGDYSDIMGSTKTVRQFFVGNKIRLNWVPDEKVVTLAQSGTQVLAASELDPTTTTSPIAYRIDIPGSPEIYLLSYRAKLGIDTNLSNNYANRLEIHRMTPDAGGPTRLASALLDGQTFENHEHRFSITENSHDESSCEFTITFNQ
jgi:hypothetical protein